MIGCPVFSVSLLKQTKKLFQFLSKILDFDGASNGYGDAIRHCYWCALNQVSAGLDSPYAKEFGDTHEDIPNNKAKVMDLHNNAVGYDLGNQA